MKSFKDHLLEGNRFDALKKAVKVHMRNQAKFIHGGEKDPKKRFIKNSIYYGSMAAIGAGTASAVTLANPKLATSAVIGSIGGLGYEHAKNIYHDYKAIRRTQK